MALEAGTKLGPYEIVSPLGAGGMGEVYRARDTRLDRTVAIKVLPAALRNDAELRQRFDREARSLSSLSHPNICTLHDVGQQEGLDFLVMEFLEGETLADRLAKKAIPRDQALKIAGEIAQALDAAHRRGVTHRDLKPSNVMLTRTGVKLLDFGLAKPKQGAFAAADQKTAAMFQSPLPASKGAGAVADQKTVALHASPVPPSPAPGQITAVGMVLGTYPYMSPEQLEGKEADARSDIFSLGIVLYELFTGQRPFQGASPASVVAAILNTEPRPMSSLQPGLPPALERLVRVCLAKDPESRWQTAHDVKLQLDGIVEQATLPTVPMEVVKPQRAAAAAPSATPAAPRIQFIERTSKREPVAWTLAGLALAAALVAGYFLWRRPAALPTGSMTPVYSTILPPEGVNVILSANNAGPPAISPDGTRIVFQASNTEGKSMLWVRDLASPAARPLPGTEDAAVPFWSPDGQWIGFFAQEKLKKMEVSGGPAVTLCEAPNGRGGAWSKDGVIVFAPDFRSGLMQVSSQGGTAQPVTTLDPAQHSTHRWPLFLPDGKRFLYLAGVHEQGQADKAGIYLASLGGKEDRLLVNSSANFAYSQGHLLFLRDSTLMAQPLDAASGELKSSAVPIAESVRRYPESLLAVLAASPSGVLFFLPGQGSTKSELIWFDRSGRRLLSVGEPDNYGDIEMSPDGTKAVVSIGYPGDLFLVDLQRGTRTRFTFKADALNMNPRWSPDGKWIAYSTHTPGGPTYDIFRKVATGAGSDEHLLPSKAAVKVGSWSPDGKIIAYSLGDPLFESESRIWTMPADGEGDATAFSHDKTIERNGMISPDGRWMAYSAREAGRFDVFVTSFPDSSGKWQVSRAGGMEPRWSRDGSEIFFRTPDNALMAATVNGKGATFEVNDVRPLFRTNMKHSFHAYVPTADSQRFLLNWVGEKESATPFALVQNWPAALKK